MQFSSVSLPSIQKGLFIREGPSKATQCFPAKTEVRRAFLGFGFGFLFSFD